MDVIYGLIPGMIILGLVALGVLFWAARSGQYDDLEGDAHRILMDDDLEPTRGAAVSESENRERKSGSDVQKVPDERGNTTG